MGYAIHKTIRLGHSLVISVDILEDLRRENPL